MGSQKFGDNVTMPFGSPLYGKPPYFYRGVQDMIIPYETDAEPLRALLPPGIEVEGNRAECIAWTRWIPFSAFGPYHEAFVMIKASFEGKRYLYNPVMVVDNEVALGVGREVWGYPKKMARFTRSWGDNTTGYGEQLLFKAERPTGQPVLTASMTCQKRANPEDLGADCPFLSFRLIPDAEDVSKPRVAELISLELPVHFHTGPDGEMEFYSGPAELALKGGASDPWHLMAPDKIRGGFFSITDFDLVPGRVVHDYLA